MAYEYIAVAVFAFLALIVPFSMILIAKLLGPKTKQNLVKLANYESAEVPIGTHKDVSNEYLHYFALYLAFEVIVVVVILWATAFKAIPFNINVYTIGLLFASFLFSILAFAIAAEKEW